MKKSIAFVFVLAALSLPNVLLASGYQLYSESATDVLGVGGAGAARSGHVSSAWYNPAATTTIDQPTIAAGGSFIKLDSTYDTPLRNDHMRGEVRMTGFLYAVQPLNPDWRLNLSVNAPFGMITQWKSHAQISNLATFSSIRACYISPSVSYKVTDELSLAAGFNVVIATARLARYIDLPYGLPRNKLYMEADATGIGYFASALWKPADDWAFAAHYQSKVRLGLEGTAHYRNLSSAPVVFKKGDVSAVLTPPAYLTLGVENTTFEDWRLMFDTVWTQWSLYDSLDLKFDKYPGTGKYAVSKNKKNWHDVWSWRFGAEYQLNSNWVLRGGYMYDVSPANDRTRDPIMPDNNKSLFALGVGYMGEKWGVDLSYAYVHFEPGSIGRKVTTTTPKGKFKTYCQILSAQVTMKF